MRKKYFELGYGGLGMFFFGAVIAILMFFFIFPDKYRKNHITSDSTASTYCRELINDADAPVITAPAYTGNTIDPGSSRQYQLIKENVPVTPYLWGGPDYAALANYEHLASSFKQAYTDPKTGKQFILRIPYGAGGRSYEFSSTVNPGLDSSLVFSEYGLLLAYHVDANGEPITIDDLPVFDWGKPHMVDIYKAVDLPPLPDWVLTCIDDPTRNATYTTDNGEPKFYYPEQNWSKMKSEEQLGWFLFRQERYVVHAWWTPHCKPAIYLYPEKETAVNVKVSIPQGSFLYTDPVYPSGGPARNAPHSDAGGWNVLAKPSGELHYLGSNIADSKGNINYPSGVFPYLYYEARIHDSAIDKPTEGFVVAYDKLPLFYAEILPKLGLNDTETQQFKQYWEKALPNSPFYFIGVVPQTNLDEIEPLTITPKQDTTIRVSLYFEALDEFQITQQPIIQTPNRSGFTVVEWGGMVKRDKNHPFTCSQ